MSLQITQPRICCLLKGRVPADPAAPSRVAKGQRIAKPSPVGFGVLVPPSRVGEQMMPQGMVQEREGRDTGSYHEHSLRM